MESKCRYGLNAMIAAWKCYEKDNNPKDSEIMKDIQKYNEFYCKVLYEILDYLRKDHS